MKKLSALEVKWLKGFSDVELENYIEQYPQRKETTEEFKRRYTYKNNKWVRNAKRRKIL